MKSLNFLIKPASSLCNLRCKYCFYEDEAQNRTMKSMGVMSQETMDLLIEEAFRNIEPNGMVHFAFQGGEPTMAGIDYFYRFAEKAHQLCPKNVQTTFAIQTNGTMLNDEWAAFFRKENFLVGISIDGYEYLHNLHRVDSHGEGSWNQVQAGVSFLRKHNVDMNVLCVVTKQMAKKTGLAYRELKKAGFEYLQFIACLDPIGEKRGQRSYSLSPDAYSKFLCGVFDLWYQDWAAGQYHSVRLFDDYVNIFLRTGASTCATCGKCGAYYVVEGDGSVYPCDFYALDPWKLGKIGENALVEIIDSEKSRGFLAWGKRKPEECGTCRWKNICNGGCKNDWYQTNGQDHNYYCSSFRQFLEYAGERLVTIAEAEYKARSGR